MANDDRAGEAPPDRGLRRPGVVSFVLGGLTLGLLALVIWLGWQVILLMFAGVLLAVVLRTGAYFASRWTGLSIRWSLSILLFATIFGGSIMVWMVAPGVAQQFAQLQENLEDSVDAISQYISDLPGGDAAINRIDNIREEGLEGTEIVEHVGGVFSNVFGAMAAMAIIGITALFLAYNPSLYVRGMVRLIPPTRRDRACEVLSALGKTLQQWLLGQFVSMAFLFVTTWIMLLLMGVPLAFILALVTGVFTFVPYIGPILAAIPILLVAFVESPTLAMYVGGLYLVIQNVEANLIMPLVFQRTVHLPPVVTIAGQLLLGAFFGVLGFILATPLTAVVLVLVQKLYVEDMLGDTMEEDIPNLPQLDS